MSSALGAMVRTQYLPSKKKVNERDAKIRPPREKKKSRRGLFLIISLLTYFHL